MCMGHATHANESQRGRWVVFGNTICYDMDESSDMWIGHVTHVNESCCTCEWVREGGVWHGCGWEYDMIETFHQQCVNGPCHTCGWIISRMWIGRTGEGWMWLVIWYDMDKSSDMRMSHVSHVYVRREEVVMWLVVTRTDDACHTYEMGMSWTIFCMYTHVYTQIHTHKHVYMNTHTCTHNEGGGEGARLRRRERARDQEKQKEMEGERGRRGQRARACARERENERERERERDS